MHVIRVRLPADILPLPGTRQLRSQMPPPPQHFFRSVLIGCFPRDKNVQHSGCERAYFNTGGNAFAPPQTRCLDLKNVVEMNVDSYVAIQSYTAYVNLIGRLLSLMDVR